MAIEIGPGWTIGGGISIVQPPPSTNTAGWWIAGGASSPSRSSYVQRVTFATDTDVGSIRGPLTYSRRGQGSTSTFTYGWVGGGAGLITTIERITFATDTASTSSRGTMFGNTNIASAGNTSYGWYGGGEYGGPPMSTVNRIDYSNDTGTASARGPLASSPGVKGLAAAGNTSYGWFAGGDDNSGYISKVSRIDYSNDTPTASIRGPLSAGRYGLTASSDNSTYCWFVAGINSSPSTVSTVDRITTANDTAVATVRGPLSMELSFSAGTGDTSYGYYGGGAPSYKSTVQRITYATDTATATTKGPLAVASLNLSATAGIQ